MSIERRKEFYNTCQSLDLVILEDDPYVREVEIISPFHRLLTKPKHVVCVAITTLHKGRR